MAAATTDAAATTAGGCSWRKAGSTPATTPRAAARVSGTLAPPNSVARTSNPGASARSTITAAVASTSTIPVGDRDTETPFADMEPYARSTAKTHTDAAVVLACSATSPDADAHVDPVLPDVDTDPDADPATGTAPVAVAGSSHAAADAAADADCRVGPVLRHGPAEPVAAAGALAAAGTVVP